MSLVRIHWIGRGFLALLTFLFLVRDPNPKVVSVNRSTSSIFPKPTKYNQFLGLSPFCFSTETTKCMISDGLEVTKVWKVVDGVNFLTHCHTTD